MDVWDERGNDVLSNIPPWHGRGFRLCGEVGAEVLLAKQSADTTEMRAGLCLLRSVSDHSPSSFSWAWGCWCQPVPETIVQVRAVRRGLKAARSKLPCYLQTKPHLSQDYPELPCASVVEEDRSWGMGSRPPTAWAVALVSFLALTASVSTRQRLGTGWRLFSSLHYVWFRAGDGEESC